MEYENPERSRKMKNQCLNLDRISSLPENIIESILSFMPIQDALRTSILSKKWQYSWQRMPRLAFRNNMVKASSHGRCRELEKYKLANAIFHVLWLHNGPTVLEFNCSIGHLRMDSEFAQIFSYLSRENKVKKLFLLNDDFSYKLPISFFSLQGLEFLCLVNCTLDPPLTFNGFSQLKSITFMNIMVSAQKLQRFLSKCPLLEQFYLDGCDIEDFDFVAGGNKFTFLDFFQCVPLIQCLDISEYYLKYLSVDGMPRKLPTSLAHLKHLILGVCMADQDEISSALCIIQNSPLLVKIKFTMYGNEKLPVRQTPTNYFDSEDHSDLKLDYLETLEIQLFSNLPLEMEFVKLIMANSPVLKKVRIILHWSFSVDDEVDMLRDLVALPLPRASPSAKLIIKRL